MKLKSIVIVVCLGLGFGFFGGLRADLKRVFKGEIGVPMTLSLETVDVTAYSPDPSQTDSTPFEMASGKIATVTDLEAQRYIAVSHDLKKFYRYGDRVYIIFEFEVSDLMNGRHKRTVDLFMRSRKIARGFGRKKAWLVTNPAEIDRLHKIDKQPDEAWWLQLKEGWGL